MVRFEIRTRPIAAATQVPASTRSLASSAVPGDLCRMVHGDLRLSHTHAHDSQRAGPNNRSMYVVVETGSCAASLGRLKDAIELEVGCFPRHFRLFIIIPLFRSLVTVQIRQFNNLSLSGPRAL